MNRRGEKAINGMDGSAARRLVPLDEFQISILILDTLDQSTIHGSAAELKPLHLHAIFAKRFGAGSIDTGF